jgi:hypothetical protein
MQLRPCYNENIASQNCDNVEFDTFKIKRLVSTELEFLNYIYQSKFSNEIWTERMKWSVFQLKEKGFNKGPS